MGDLARQAEGRWYGILAQLGVDPTFLRNRHGPCPACGGVDRFRWDDKDGKGTFYCSGGGEPLAGDGFGLVKHLHNCDFPTAAKLVEEALGGTPSKFIARKSPPRERPTHDLAEAIWESTKPDSFRVWDHEVAGHPYAQLKGITHAYGAARGRVSGRLIGRDADCLLVPMRELNGDFTGVEVIGIPVDGMTPKQTFGRKGYLILGNTLDKTIPIYITEGWADAVATWQIFGNVVVISVFGNTVRQEELLFRLDKKNPTRRHIVVKDAE